LLLASSADHAARPGMRHPGEVCIPSSWDAAARARPLLPCPSRAPCGGGLPAPGHLCTGRRRAPHGGSHPRTAGMTLPQATRERRFFAACSLEARTPDLGCRDAAMAGCCGEKKRAACVLLRWGRDKIREAASCAGNNVQKRWLGRVRFYLPLRTTDPEHYRFLFHISGFICIWYRWPDGSGPTGRHVNDPKKHDTRTTRHEGDSASGWPDLMVGPGMGRTLGTVARHGHNTIFGLA
jgi:hypothetical protein